MKMEEEGKEKERKRKKKTGGHSSKITGEHRLIKIKAVGNI